MPNSVSGALKEVRKAHDHYAGKDQRMPIAREMGKGAIAGGVGGAAGGPAGAGFGAAVGAGLGAVNHIIDRTGRK